MDCLVQQWFVPGGIFFVYFSILMFVFSCLDYVQPQWYQNCAIDNKVPGNRQTYQVRVIIPTVLKNMSSSFLIGTLLWVLRIGLLPSTCTERWSSNSNFFMEYILILLYVLCILYVLTGSSEALVSLFMMLGFLAIGESHVFLQLFLSYLVSQIVFSVNHHLAHRCNLHWHHKHHEYHSPIAICAFYCHFMEMLLLNLPVAELGPLLFNLDPWPHTLWLLMAGTYVTLDHCGHQFGPTWLFNTLYHHQHHKNGNIHHGSFVLDRILA